MSSPIEPFSLAVPEETLLDLRRRLAMVRWPDRETVDDGCQGVPLDAAEALITHWQDAYDWRRCERMLNGFGQYCVTIDGLSIHFLHVRSADRDAVPLLLTHGWPGSVIEFHKVIAPLTAPSVHGHDPADAFHLVIPSLPGYGFSGKPASSGWNVERIARAWAALMQTLGYERYFAQGGDWGSAVTVALGHLAPPGLAGIHVNLVPFRMDGAVPATEDEKQTVAMLAAYNEWDSGYSKQQSTRPQTLGYALADSPVGQAMWIYEKFRGWTDSDGQPERVLSRDEMLDNIMLYWLGNNGASSARLYWESFQRRPMVEVSLPAGATIFPKEIVTPPRSVAERTFTNLVYWNEAERGGHFAAFEQPDLFVDEVRNCFRLMR